MPTVRMPSSRHIFEMIGAPPVPVPPPIPAQMKAIFVFTSRILFISSRLSSVACLPISGFAPAPSPCVKCGPSCTRFGTLLCAIACASVFHIIKFTPSMFWLNMWFTALLPPPPTPTTLMMEDFSLGKSKWIILDIVLMG